MLDIIDSTVNLFIYLIEGIRSGPRKNQYLELKA